LVFGPRLLLMDEPLAALDRRLRERMQAEIRAIQRKLAITVIYITHDQQEAMTLADVLVVMNKGRAEQVGPPLDVYHRPRTRFVGEFLGDTNILDAAVESADGTVVVCRTAQGDTVVIEAGEPAAIGQPVTLAIRPEHVRFATNEAVECNQLVGEITEVVDWGVSRRYHVAIPGAERAVLVTEPGHPNVPARSLGDKAILAFDIGDVVLVAAST
jgi:putative spermidine/putrescine transport system ATP-binding protein